MVAWDMYFAGICSFQFHPKNAPADRLSVEQCAEIADMMMVERDKRDSRRYKELSRG